MENRRRRKEEKGRERNKMICMMNTVLIHSIQQGGPVTVRLNELLQYQDEWMMGRRGKGKRREENGNIHQEELKKLKGQRIEKVKDEDEVYDFISDRQSCDSDPIPMSILI